MTKKMLTLADWLEAKPKRYDQNGDRYLDPVQMSSEDQDLIVGALRHMASQCRAARSILEGHKEPSNAVDAIARTAEHTAAVENSGRTFASGSAAPARQYFERIIASLNYDGNDPDSLTVGEIRRTMGNDHD